MSEKKFQLVIVSAEEELFSEPVLMITVRGSEGEMGIVPNHVPLLTKLIPGEVRIRRLDQSEEDIYVQGGILEIQPNVVTILSDTALRAKDIDEARAIEAKERAESILKNREAGVEYATVLEELSRATAQLRMLKKLRHH